MAAPVSRVLEGDLLPPRLRDLAEPPLRVHLVGELPRGPGVAVVGTRTPSNEGRAFAGNLAAGLAREGIVVLSGGADGIDTAAHEGALVAGGATVVVAPAGCRRPFPEGNRLLFDRITASGGAYLSLVPDDEPAIQASFFARNACLVALSHAVVVVETRVRGGARNAAKWARRLGRPLLVVPSAPWIPSGTGCQLELRRGAAWCLHLADVLEELERALAIPQGLAAAARRESPAEEPIQQELPFLGDPSGIKGEPDALRVLRAVQGGARHLDAICELTGLPPGVVQSHVLTLTLEGVLVAGPAGALRATPVQTSVSPRNLPE